MIAAQLLSHMLAGCEWAMARRNCGTPVRIRWPSDRQEQLRLIDAHLDGSPASLLCYAIQDAGEVSWRERVSAVELGTYLLQADRRTQLLVIDLDGADHSDKGLAEPAHAARMLASAADCFGALGGLLVCKSRRGVGRHVWLFLPEPTQLQAAVVGCARWVARAKCQAHDDWLDTGQQPFRTPKGTEVEVGQPGAFELRPHSDTPPQFGWAIQLPFSGAARRNNGGGVAVEPFDGRPIELHSIPRCDPQAWRELSKDLPTAMLAPRRPIVRSAATGHDAVDSARRYVAKMPAAISGQAGHDATFRVACVLVGTFQFSEHTALELLREYSARCQPPWSDSELTHKVRDAARRCRESAA